MFLLLAAVMPMPILTRPNFSSGCADPDLPGKSRARGPEQAPRCKNPATKASLELALKEFVAPLISAPPRIVLVTFDGHGIRDRGTMYLVPANANLSEHADLAEQCLSHHQLFGLLKKELEDKIKIEDVQFIVILNMCQYLPTFLKHHEVGFMEGLEPCGSSRPRHWALCTSTANGTKADDGVAEQMSCSPYLQELLSVECGFLEKNVSVKLALGRARSRLLEQDGQEPYLFSAGLGEICLYGPSTRIPGECDVFICHRDGTNAREIAKELHDELVKMPVGIEDVDSSRNIKVFFEPSEGNTLQRDQIADALRSSTVIVFLVPQGTFEGISALQSDAPGDGTLTRLLVQYEMALEMCALRSDVTVLPLLVGSKIPGQSVYDYVNHFDEVQMSEYWPVHAVPEDLRVQSIVKSALAGLRRDFDVAQNLPSKRLNTGVPSILQSSDGNPSKTGRTIKQTLSVFRSAENFTPHIFHGSTRDAIQSACKKIQERVSSQHQKRRRGREGESFDGARKTLKKSHDEDSSGKQSVSPDAGVADARKSVHTNYDANEGSSSSAKRHKSDSSPASTGASMGGGAAGVDAADCTADSGGAGIERINKFSAGKEVALEKICDLPSLKRFNRGV